MVMSDLYTLFNNQKVALIGNAESMLDTQHGAEIDQNDIICRINKGPELMGRNSHGTRLTVLFFSHPDWLPTNKISSDVVRIHTSHRFNPSFMNDIEEQKFTPSVHTDYFFQKTEWEKLRQQIGYTQGRSWPSTGATAISMIVDARPQSLSLYGFDFKKTYTFYHADKTGDPATLHDLKRKHNWTLERLYVEKLISEHPWISLK
jgi:hypothetical protein